MSAVLGIGLGLLLSSCSSAEDVAVAAEREAIERTCSIGELATVQRCGGVQASCHVCGRPDGVAGVCLQPCTVGKDDCAGGGRCVPIGGLTGGYARIGDCPTGYCE